MNAERGMRSAESVGGTRWRMAVVAACLLVLATGCAGPRVVFLPAADAPVRAGPDVSGRVYVWTGAAWELSRNHVTVPEGFYIWDAGDKTPAPVGK